jgi:hypothetical protein
MASSGRGDAMKAREWRDILEEQRRSQGKVLFTRTELAHLGRVDRKALNVEIWRLRRQGILLRYAHGLHGLPGAAGAEDLLAAIDSHAYMTGLHALHRHNVVDQVPATITCFTDRRSPRAAIRETPVARFKLVLARGKVYAPPGDGVLAGPEQALCDFVYLCRRAGVEAVAQGTFRGLDRLSPDRLRIIAARYPSTVQTDVLSAMTRMTEIATAPSMGSRGGEKE